MADGFTVAVETAAVSAALARLPDAAQALTRAASQLTAERLQAEMRSRVARATGQTAEDILVTEVAGDFYVHTLDVAPVTGRYYQVKHVGLWLEKGTRQGQPGSHAAPARPWFFVSAQLEQGPHERRIREALEQAVDGEGLGD